jgi:hypothetical protein
MVVAGEKEGDPIISWVGHGPGNWPTRGWPKLMEISLADIKMEKCLAKSCIFRIIICANSITGEDILIGRWQPKLGYAGQA